MELAKSLRLHDERIERIRIAGLLHDVGKIGVPTPVLIKEGPLNLEDLDQLARHSELGHAMIAGGGMPEEARVVFHVHERWDGGGYPDKLAGEDIPLESRIICAADALDRATRPTAHRKPARCARRWPRSSSPPARSSTRRSPRAWSRWSAAARSRSRARDRPGALGDRRGRRADLGLTTPRPHPLRGLLDDRVEVEPCCGRGKLDERVHQRDQSRPAGPPQASPAMPDPVGDWVEGRYWKPACRGRAEMTERRTLSEARVNRIGAHPWAMGAGRSAS